jgi:hypothetical protein
VKRQLLSRCHVCSSREHAALDLALARGVSPRALSRRYNIGIDAIYRHAKNHMPPQLRAKLTCGPSIEGVDLDRLREAESQSLLMNLIGLRNRLLSSLDVAEEAGDANMTARVAAQLHRNLEVTGSLLGDLTSGSTTINNVLVLPAYVEMRVELIRALAPYPEARQAVAQVLHAVEHKAARAIKAEEARGLAHVSP